MSKDKTQWHFCYWDEIDYKNNKSKTNQHGTKSNTSRKETSIETIKTRRS